MPWAPTWGPEHALPEEVLSSGQAPSHSDAIHPTFNWALPDDILSGRCVPRGPWSTEILLPSRTHTSFWLHSTHGFLKATPDGLSPCASEGSHPSLGFLLCSLTTTWVSAATTSCLTLQPPVPGDMMAQSLFHTAELLFKPL